jgi:hypothetical protein
MLQAARPFMGAGDLSKMVTSSQDRKADMVRKAQESQERMETSKNNAQMLHEFRMSKLSNDDDKAAETARHNRVMEGINQSNAAMNAQLKSMGLDLQKMNLDLSAEKFKSTREQQDQKSVQAFGAGLERAGIPESDAVLRQVETLLEKDPKVAEWISGPKAVIPDLVAPKNATDARQAFQKLFNITLKDRSGAAVTIPEFERLKAEFASGTFKTPEQLKEGVKQARNIVTQHYRGISAGFNPATVESYNRNLEGSGGTPVLGGRTAPPPPSGFRVD